MREIAHHTHLLSLILSSYNAPQPRPPNRYQVLQGLSQKRLAVRVLAARHHCYILAMLVLCSGTRRHEHRTVVRSADVGQHDRQLVPVLEICIYLVQDGSFSSQRFHDLFQRITG